MRRRPAVGAVALSLLVAVSAWAQPTTSASFDVVTELRIHGNYSIADADVIQLAGVGVGDRIDDAALDAMVERLRASNRFESVEVRKRYTSLSRSDEVALILVVREKAAPNIGNPVARVLTTAARQTMFMPILDYAEGNGWTYGARFSLVELLGDRGRVSVPLTLGGTRQAALELEKGMDGGGVDMVRAGVSGWRSEHNHFLVDDRNKYVWYSQTGREHLFDLENDPQEECDLALAGDAEAQLQPWRAELVEILGGRPEGCVENGALVKGRPHRPIMPGYDPEQTFPFA